MAIIFWPGQMPATFTQVMAWCPRAFPGHSNRNPGAAWEASQRRAAAQPLLGPVLVAASAVRVRVATAGRRAAVVEGEAGEAAAWGTVPYGFHRGGRARSAVRLAVSPVAVMVAVWYLRARSGASPINATTMSMSGRTIQAALACKGAPRSGAAR